jgi:hypothetical protein
MSRIVKCASGRLVPFNVQDPEKVRAAVHESAIHIPEKSPLSGCRSAHLVGNDILVARCVLRGGRSQEAAFKLDTLFGLIDGRLRPFGHDFHASSDIQDVSLDGSILSIDLVDKPTQNVDLDEFIANVNGKLVLKKEGPCGGCLNAFRAHRLYSPMGDRHREKLDFNISNVNQNCAMCKIIEQIINSTVPFIRSCEVFLESWSEYLGGYSIETVELDVSVNNISERYRLYLDNGKSPH